jgi:uncharacterized protein (TIGR02246 family)
MVRTSIGVIAVLALTAGVVFTASKSDDDVLRQARDRAEIEDVMWQYTRALDTGNGEAYAALYTPDGQFSAGQNPTKGRDALRKMVGDPRERQAAAEAKGEAQRPPMYHMTANHRITFIDKDHAKIEAYYLTAQAAGGANAPLRVAAVGRSVDELVRQNGKWLIASRNVAPQN